MSSIASLSNPQTPKTYIQTKQIVTEKANEVSFLQRIWDTTLKEFEKAEGFKNFIKAPATYLGAFGQFYRLTPFTVALSSSSSLMENGLAWASLPNNVQDLWKRIKKTVCVLSGKKEELKPISKEGAFKDKHPRLHTLYKTCMKLNAFIPTFHDGIKFFTDKKINVLHLSKSTLSILGTINNAGLLIYSSDEIRKNIDKIAAEKTETTDSPELVKKTMNRIVYHLLNLATNVSYVALAIFGLATLFIAHVPAWGIPLSAAFALTFTFAAIYFKGIKDDPKNPYIGEKLKKFRAKS